MSGFGQIFSKDTQAIFYNWKQNPVQRMLDFDFLCGEPPPLPFLLCIALIRNQDLLHASVHLHTDTIETLLQLQAVQHPQ